MDWLRTHEFVAIWLEGIALILIFVWDRLDSRTQHKETLAQLGISQKQVEASQHSAAAAKASADALINSERAWIVVELIPMALKYGGQWYRANVTVPLTEEEILAGYHLRYKLKFTNMGRTPAQISGFTIVYSCLGEGVTDLPESGGGERVMTSYRPFERLLGRDGQAIEVEEPIIDMDSYMRDHITAINELQKTAVIHGWVKYRHMFSTTEDWYSDFCYFYTVSQQRLTVVGRHTKQRQEKAN